MKQGCEREGWRGGNEEGNQTWESTKEKEERCPTYLVALKLKDKVAR